MPKDGRKDLVLRRGWGEGGGVQFSYVVNFWGGGGVKFWYTTLDWPPGRKKQTVPYYPMK